MLNISGIVEIEKYPYFIYSQIDILQDLKLVSLIALRNSCLINFKCSLTYGRSVFCFRPPPPTKSRFHLALNPME